MNFSEKDFIAPSEVLSDVMSFTGEQRLEGVTKGFIYSQMNKCLEELSYNTFYNVVSKTFDFPENRILEIPEKLFNIKEVFGYSGDSCTIGNSKNIYWKRNYYHNGGEGVARNKQRNLNDPFYGGNGFDKRIQANVPNSVSRDSTMRSADRILYYGYQQGKLYFSPECKIFSNLLIKFNGISSLNPNEPSIPRYFRQVVTDWCTERVLRVKKVDSPQQWRLLWSDSLMALDRNGFKGSWYNAETLVKRMGSKEKEDLKEYLSRLNY